MKKLSFLGILLVAASALTAAILPSKPSYKFVANGVQVRDSANETDCRIVSGTKNCETFDTALSGQDDTGDNTAGTTIVE